MSMRRAIVLAVVLVAAVAVYRFLIEAMVGFLGTHAFAPPQWWPEVWTSKKAHYVSWWQFTHLVGTVFIAAPIAIAMALFFGKRAWAAAAVVTLAAVGIEQAWHLSSAISGTSATSLQVAASVDLLKYLLVLPVLAALAEWGMSLNMAFQRTASGGR